MSIACKNFDDSLLEAVDFAFYSLGKACRQSLYYHLKKSFHIKRSEIPSKIKEFDSALRMIFKDGAIFLERLILENLCKTLLVEIDTDHFTDFMEAISTIKNMVLEREHLLLFPDFDGDTVASKWKRRSFRSSKLR